MAGIIFLMWHFTIGVIFCKYHTTRILGTDPQSIYDILNRYPGNLRPIAWYCAMIVVIVIWPVLQFNRIRNWIRKKFTHYSESK